MRRAVTMAVLVVGLSALAGTPALAYEEEKNEGCANALITCFERAALVDDFWRRWASGIDCELDFIECARIKIMGR